MAKIRPEIPKSGLETSPELVGDDPEFKEISSSLYEFGLALEESGLALDELGLESDEPSPELRADDLELDEDGLTLGRGLPNEVCPESDEDGLFFTLWLGLGLSRLE